MWNPFEKKPEPSIWKTALVYDHEVVDLEEFYGSTAKAKANLLFSKGIPVKWVFTLMYNNQWVDMQEGYEVKVEYRDRDKLTWYAWRKVKC